MTDRIAPDHSLLSPERGRSGSAQASRGRGVTAVLGPTNTGKTHLAIERMLGHESGVIGLPLRLLAREVYDKMAARAGASAVALITGEEKILPKHPRYYVCTVEAMPREIDVAFLAVDEIQLCADPERGHVFTRHLLQARGEAETLMLGAATMKDAVKELLPGANIISRPRLSKLSYAGEKKISRLPRRSAVVTFTAQEVYAIAELVRRQRGGAAVVLGALSPKTRNAQVELYQNGDVDFLIATDAIGMGLNLDLDHVAFASLTKFDGRQRRELTNAEIGQVAGRAGRHTNDGSFGVTAGVAPFDQARVAALEAHAFEAVNLLQWRNGNLDFSTVQRLLESLRAKPGERRLMRGGIVDDVLALENVSKDEQVQALASAPAAIRRLWDVCQIPDYRKISAADHAALAIDVYRHLMSDTGVIAEDWFAEQVRYADNTEGDIDALSNRISHIRTWTFVSHRSDWLADPGHWQERTRAIEDKLSDALHERLTQRFVDRRTSVLMKRMRDRDALNAEIEGDGSVYVERHYVGRLEGLHFTPDTRSAGVHGKAARHAAAQVMTEELSERAKRLCAAADGALELTRSGQIVWEGAAVAQVAPGDAPLRPELVILADEHLSDADKERVATRFGEWLNGMIAERLKPLTALAAAEDVTGLGRGVAFRLVENLGVLKREEVAGDVKQLDQAARGQLRRYGVRFGAFNIFMPALLKPAASDLALLLWALHHGKANGFGANALPEPPREGLTSAQPDPALPEAFYRAAGFHHCGRRVVRIDMLERLADMIRPLIAWRPGKTEPAAPAPEAKDGQTKATQPDAADGEVAGESAPAQTPAAAPAELAKEEQPEGATGDGGFRVTADMMSIIGCSGEEMASVLKALGFRCERRPLAAVETTAPAATVATADGATAEANASAAEPAAAEDAAANGETPAEPAMDEIWRPRRKAPREGFRKGRGKGPRFSKGEAKQGKGPRTRAAKGGGKDGARQGGKGAPKPKPRDTFDPDSPFAALKDLKRDLETRVKDRA